MNETICIFGHVVEEFLTPADFVRFIIEDIFFDCAARYRRGLPARTPTGILLCCEGAIYGRFDVSGREPATEADRRRFAQTEWVYRVVRSARYEVPVLLETVEDIGRIDYCPNVPRAVFNDIEQQAGQITYFHHI